MRGITYLPKVRDWGIGTPLQMCSPEPGSLLPLLWSITWHYGVGHLRALSPSRLPLLVASKASLPMGMADDLISKRLLGNSRFMSLLPDHQTGTLPETHWTTQDKHRRGSHRVLSSLDSRYSLSVMLRLTIVDCCSLSQSQFEVRVSGGSHSYTTPRTATRAPFTWDPLIRPIPT